MKDQNIAIVGLGVVGGSFALALREAGYQNVTGLDADQETLDKALAAGAITRGSRLAGEILPDADLVILALYPGQILPFVREHRALLKTGALLTDVAGVKSSLAARLPAVMPEGVEFVLGHPMAGREKKGFDYASARVFKGANYILTPLPHNQEKSLRTVEALVLSLGFKRVCRLAPEAHDEIIAFTSQLPHAMAVALVNSDSPERETGRYIGDSYRELTRIANINGALWTELFLENRKPLLEVIEGFERELGRIKAALASGDGQTLTECFAESSRRRAGLDI
jgi:prephenate dehydrogenase